MYDFSLKNVRCFKAFVNNYNICPSGAHMTLGCKACVCTEKKKETYCSLNISRGKEGSP